MDIQLDEEMFEGTGEPEEVAPLSANTVQLMKDLGPKCLVLSNACATNPCLNGGTCLNYENTYQCKYRSARISW